MTHPFREFTRRSFIKSTASMAAAAGCVPTLFLPRARDLSEGGFTYHPHVDPLRVVGLHDPAMTTALKPRSPWKTQEKLVQADVVARNIDRLACALTGEKRARDAWRAIFLKPSGKPWNDVKVAVKTNNLGRQHTKSAVMAKLCRVLTRELGVKPSHIIIYDASVHGKDMAKKSPFTGLPEGTVIAADWKGMTGEAELGPPYRGNPWMENKNRTACLEPLVKGEVDILVNIALCKGHEPEYGGFTMCMKNHLGTFDPKPAHARGRTEYLIAVNKTPVILGPIDWKGKRILFPRQQLCLVDALWASERGPVCPSSAQPNRLFMGTLAPVVDYVVATAFRKKTAFWPINAAVAERFLKEFGIRPSDLPGGGGILDAGEPA